jgi:carbon-monoxide dehydrogenase medium subunit
MKEFDYLEPASVQEACKMLAELGDECRMIAGGTALMLAMRQRMLTPKYLISLGKLRRLRGISFDEQLGLRIGAFTLHAQLARSALVREHYPMLAEMASHVANPQVRNQGTIGGNLCYADPATDPPSCLMALDARVVLEGVGRQRELPIEDFLVDYYSTALEPDEVVTQIRVPAPTFTAGRHVRYLRTAAEHRPLLNVACTIRERDGVCEEVRIVIGASTRVPTRGRQCEAFLRGKPMTDEVAARASSILANSIEPISDFRGSGDYRKEMINVIGRRTLEGLFTQIISAQEFSS